MDIREIAKRAKVSTATVSRTINRVPTVDPQLASRVWRVVEEIGYFPNSQARALVSGHSRIFGLIASEILNPFFPEIVQVFEETAVRHNYEILVSSTVRDPQRMVTAVRRMLERRVEGVAVMTFGMEESLLADLTLRNIPLVFVDVGPSRPRVSNIKLDYLNGIRQAVQHLAALRHRRIGFITGPLNLKSAVMRRDAFVESVREIGIPVEPELIVEGNHTMEGGIDAFRRLHGLVNPPTAIMCSNDMTAIGVMRSCYEVGVSIPKDISLIGFDNLHLTEFVVPPLTTVEMSQAELGRLAFEALFQEVQRAHPKPEGTIFQLKTNLVLRRTTAMASRAGLARRRS
jgi:LacI family transcriptional regulator